MKKILLIALLILPALAFSQTAQPPVSIPLPLDTLSKLVTWQGVVQAPGVSKDELFTRARQWFAVTFKSAASVLQMEDRTGGKLVGRGNSGMNEFGRISYIIAITVKEGRYRYEITNFVVLPVIPIGYKGGNHYVEAPVEWYGESPSYKLNRFTYKKDAVEIFEATKHAGEILSSTLQTAMSSKAAASKDDF